jgi:hypothetical protein
VRRDAPPEFGSRLSVGTATFVPKISRSRIDPISRPRISSLLTTCVDVGRVEHVDPGVERLGEEFAGLRFVDLASELPRVQRHRTDPQPGTPKGPKNRAHPEPPVVKPRDRHRVIPIRRVMTSFPADVPDDARLQNVRTAQDLSPLEWKW